MNKNKIIHQMKIVNDYGIFHLKNGNLHRVSQPAVVWTDGQKEWWYRGNYHRDDGPAIEQPDGSVSWYLFGKRYDSEQEYNRAKKYNQLNTDVTRSCS